MVALKNGGIARGIYPCIGCCPMGDLDVLIDKRNFKKAHEILINERYIFKFRNPPEKVWMREKYNLRSDLLLPCYYIRRLADLTFKRLKT